MAGIYNTMDLFPNLLFGLLLYSAAGFQNADVRPKGILRYDRNLKLGAISTSLHSHILLSHKHYGMYSGSPERAPFTKRIPSLFRYERLDTIQASGLQNARTAGSVFMFGIRSAKNFIQKAKALPKDVKKITLSDIKPLQIIKALHGPITYLILSFAFAKKFPSMFKNMFYWLWVAFCIKWFRARYVFKIPVWDRQPNWNNIITSKEQEKDLKAFTCKKCGSTLFIAKTREFFFEGSTGIGGLGCFACGAKGAENFVMDRDRIVENVADIDDYFEYERPLDFISAAERRRVLKETGGDEDAANKLLVDRENAKASDESQAAANAAVNGSTGTMTDNDDGDHIDDVQADLDDVYKENEDKIEVVSSSNTAKKMTKSTSSSSVVDDEDMDILDMDMDSDLDKF